MKNKALSYEEVVTIENLTNVYNTVRKNTKHKDKILIFELFFSCNIMSIYNTLKDEDSYSYLDKQTYKYIPISEEDIKEIRRIFIERVNRKKEKYSDELKELEDKIELNKRNTKLAKVIEFPLNFE